MGQLVSFLSPALEATLTLMQQTISSLAPNSSHTSFQGHHSLTSICTAEVVRVQLKKKKNLNNMMKDKGVSE